MRAKTISQADATNVIVVDSPNTTNPSDGAGTKNGKATPSDDHPKADEEVQPSQSVSLKEPATSSTLASTPEGDEANLSDGAVHPLKHTWTLYHDSKSRNAPPTADPTQTAFGPGPDGHAYAANLTTVGDFNSVEGFCQYFNWLKPPSKLEKNSNYHLFKDGIKPMWEDKANAEVSFHTIEAC